jgi:tetratricopeptide (TPR) repeat protein
MSLWVGLIGAVATIPLVQTVTVAKNPVEINRVAKAITVLITSKDAQGSGVILQHQGDVYTVLTAAHVVKKKVGYKIATPDGREYEVISSSIKSAPGDIDLAVVKFRSTANYTTAKLGNCNPLEGGMDLYVAGFPVVDDAITSVILAFREGKVTANSNKVFANGYSLVYSNDTLAGMSGGAVLNSDGELVAIHGKGDRDKDVDGKIGNKNGFNLGISINRFGMVASRMGVELNGQIAAVSGDLKSKADDYVVAGIQKFQKGDIRGSLADYNRAIQINSNYAAAYLNRGGLKYLNLNDTQGGLADLDRAIQINPNYAEAYFTRGAIEYVTLKDNRGALTDYNRAIQINPNYAAAYFARGGLKYVILKDPQGGLVDLKQAAKLFQQQGDTNNYKKTIELLSKLGKVSDNSRF